MTSVFLCVKSAPAPANRMALEVAWVHESGRRESHLVKPPAAWLPLLRAVSTRDGSEAFFRTPLAELVRDGVDVRTLASRVVNELWHPDIRVFASTPEEGVLLGGILGTAGEQRGIEVWEMAEAYGEAYLPAFMPLPGPRGRHWKQVTAQLVETAGEVMGRCSDADAAAHVDDGSALAGAERLWRLWRAIGVEATRMAS